MSLTPQKKIGLSLQVIGIALLIINIYRMAKLGSTNNFIIPIGLFLVIGGMLMVISKKKE